MAVLKNFQFFLSRPRAYLPVPTGHGGNGLVAAPPKGERHGTGWEPRPHGIEKTLYPGFVVIIFTFVCTPIVYFESGPKNWFGVE